MKILTDKQQQIFSFILEFYQAHGVMPGYQELQDEFDYRSSNSVYQHLQALVKKNYLQQSDHGGYDIHPTRFSMLNPEARPLTGIPIRGQIAAGGMHEAIGEDLGRIPVEIVSPRRPYLFGLQVTGNSMIEADIRDRDIIILDQREPNRGEVGAVLYNGETSLKRVYKKSDGIELVPENSNHQPIHIRPGEWEQVTVFGTFIGKAWKDTEGWRLFLRI